MKEYHWVVNDRPTLTFSIQREGVGVDLSTYTARFKAKSNSTSVFLCSGACTSLTSTGSCQYVVGVGEFSSAGMYSARIMLTTGSKSEHTERFRLVLEGV